MFAFIIMSAFGIIFLAQVPNIVNWTVTSSEHTPLKPRAKTSLDISAEVQDGWHVYALTQAAVGPTPLRITLGEIFLVPGSGPITASTPFKEHDASFDLEAKTYTYAFAVHVPMQIKADASAGSNWSHSMFHYQFCSDRNCLSPREVHLSAPLDIDSK